MSKRYRLVSDYGYNDKSWLERDLTEEQAIEAFSTKTRHTYLTIQQVLYANHFIYSIEEDHPDDVEDWDWMDS